MRACLESLGMLAYLLTIGMVLACAISLAGCEKKETLFELESPAGGVEVRKSENGVEVEVESKEPGSDDAEIEIDAGGDAGKRP